MSSRRSRPKRSLGQNFLIDPNYRRKIVEAVPCEDADRVIEIGPGRGALTEGLLARSPSLVVIEKDRDLAEQWQERAGREPNLTVVAGDVLDHPIATFGDPTGSVVVGNIPYNVTTPILFHVLERPRCREVLLMVQREVADRISAPPSTSAYGALSVGVRIVADVEHLFHVPPTAFRPRPKVESTVIRVRPHSPPRLDEEDEAWTRRVTRAVFQWRRKQIAKSLRDHPDLRLGAAASEVFQHVPILPRSRPETLDPPTFVALARVVRRIRRGPPSP